MAFLQDAVNELQMQWSAKPTNTQLVIKPLEWEYTFRIYSLPSLTALYLNDNHFSGKIQKFNSKTLSVVALKQNQLEGPIPKSLLLHYLTLSQNNLSGQISSTAYNLKKLLVLDLGSNSLNGTIPQCLGEMRILWILDLSNNNLCGTITTFRFGNQLYIIKLDENKLEGKIPRSLINCKDLKLLNLGNNQLNDTFPRWLGTLPSLMIGVDFSVYDNSLTIATKGLDLSFVRVLRSMNKIINLSRNRFEGHIPNMIGDLVGLRTLNLSHNGLEGHIPASLQHLSVLESLDLSSNKIGGEIPPQLAFLTFLEVLNLSQSSCWMH
ncbi:hypothetical protein BC332_28950 [Capsicum chinense]|nr:hypothetical protein BC332_28950 [Capsicum chinense]